MFKILKEPNGYALEINHQGEKSDTDMFKQHGS